MDSLTKTDLTQISNLRSTGVLTNEVVSLIRKIFKYNPEEGILYPNYKRQGGYLSKTLSPKYYAGVGRGLLGYYTHVIIWIYVTGTFPSRFIDHIDGNKNNNKWKNLRLATKSQNGMNVKLRNSNTSGCKGIHRCNNGRWRARINANSIVYNLGYFATYEEAVAARREAEIKYHGEFARAE